MTGIDHERTKKLKFRRTERRARIDNITDHTTFLNCGLITSKCPWFGEHGCEVGNPVELKQTNPGSISNAVLSKLDDCAVPSKTTDSSGSSGDLPIGIDPVGLKQANPGSILSALLNKLDDRAVLTRITNFHGNIRDLPIIIDSVGLKQANPDSLLNAQLNKLNDHSVPHKTTNPHGSSRDLPIEKGNHSQEALIEKSGSSSETYASTYKRKHIEEPEAECSSKVLRISQEGNATSQISYNFQSIGRSESGCISYSEQKPDKRGAEQMIQRNEKITLKKARRRIIEPESSESEDESADSRTCLRIPFLKLDDVLSGKKNIKLSVHVLKSPVSLPQTTKPKHEQGKLTKTEFHPSSYFISPPLQLKEKKSVGGTSNKVNERKIKKDSKLSFKKVKSKLLAKEKNGMERCEAKLECAPSTCQKSTKLQKLEYQPVSSHSNLETTEIPGDLISAPIKKNRENETDKKLSSESKYSSKKVLSMKKRNGMEGCKSKLEYKPSTCQKNAELQNLECQPVTSHSNLETTETRSDKKLNKRKSKKYSKLSFRRKSPKKLLPNKKGNERKNKKDSKFSPERKYSLKKLLSIVKRNGMEGIKLKLECGLGMCPKNKELQNLECQPVSSHCNLETTEVNYDSNPSQSQMNEIPSDFNLSQSQISENHGALTSQPSSYDHSQCPDRSTKATHSDKLVQCTLDDSEDVEFLGSIPVEDDCCIIRESASQHVKQSSVIDGTPYTSVKEPPASSSQLCSSVEYSIMKKVTEYRIMNLYKNFAKLDANDKKYIFSWHMYDHEPYKNRNNCSTETADIPYSSDLHYKMMKSVFLSELKAALHNKQSNEIVSRFCTQQ